MGEKRTIIDHATLDYSGLFSVKDLHKEIKDWFGKNSYVWIEVQSSEFVKENGKEIYINLQPWKKISDYAKFQVKVEVFMTEVKDAEVEKDGVKVKLNKGSINIILDGYLITDYENRWEQKAMYVFIRTLYDKFILRSQLEKYEAILSDEVEQLRSIIKSHLNLYRF